MKYVDVVDDIYNRLDNNKTLFTSMNHNEV